MTFPEELISEDQASSDFSVTCPYLGTMPDPHTSVAYPSGANLCHRANDPQLVSLAHQSQHCLVEAYDNCPTFREDHIPVSSIDVGGPVRKKANWQRPLAIIAVVLLFGVVAFGAYTLFSPFQAEPVDASVPSIQESEETTLASNNLPTPTLLIEPEEAVIDEDQMEALAEDSESVDAAEEIVVDDSEPAGVASDGASEDAKMAPASETPTPTALPDTDQIAAADSDDDVSETSTTFESLPETKPLPTAEAGSEETEQPAVEATAVSADESTASATAVPSPTIEGDIADGTAVIQTGALNVRRGPGPQFPSFTRAHNGEYVTLLGRNGDSSWVKVRLFNGYEGWIYTEYIAAGQSLDELPYIPRSRR